MKTKVNSGPSKKAFKADQPIRMYDQQSPKPAKQPRSYVRPNTSAVTEPQRQRMETPLYQSSEIAQGTISPTSGILMQTSQKDYTAARPGSDDSALPKNAPGRNSGTAGECLTRSRRAVIPTHRLDL